MSKKWFGIAFQTWLYSSSLDKSLDLQANLRDLADYIRIWNTYSSLIIILVHYLTLDLVFLFFQMNWKIVVLIVGIQVKGTSRIDIEKTNCGIPRDFVTRHLPNIESLRDRQTSSLEANLSI